MPRRRKHADLVTGQENQAADELEELIRNVRSSKPRRRSTRGAVSVQSIQESFDECEKMRDSDDWSKATARHLVALYSWCHEQVYGAAPAELVGYVWKSACSAAAKMVTEQFDGDYQKAVEFVRWTWAREHGREEWRIKNQQQGSRIGWKLQFVTMHILTDYRIDMARRAKMRGKKNG